MTGNDIADLSAAMAESNWKRKGYLAKIFTAAEQAFIQHASNPDAMVWRLWTMKESAYKIFVRTNAKRFFAPLKFECRIQSGLNGTVMHAQQVYKTSTVVSDQYVYSTAMCTNPGNYSPVNVILTLPAATGEREKQQLICKQIFQHFQQHTGLKQEMVKLVKTARNVPALQSIDGQLIPVSITHHGRFAAFTIDI